MDVFKNLVSFLLVRVSFPTPRCSINDWLINDQSVNKLVCRHIFSWIHCALHHCVKKETPKCICGCRKQTSQTHDVFALWALITFFKKRYGVIGGHNVFWKALLRYDPLKKSVMALLEPPRGPPPIAAKGEIDVDRRREKIWITPLLLPIFRRRKMI